MSRNQIFGYRWVLLVYMVMVAWAGGFGVSLGKVIEIMANNKYVYHTLPGIDDWQTWPLEELEKQISPSRWSTQNLTSDQVVAKYIKVGFEGTNDNRVKIPSKLNVPYGPTKDHVMDIYGVDLAPNSPVLLWIHGGYWQEGSKDMSGHFANTMYENSVVTCVLGYPLAPKATIKDMQTATILAIKKLSLLYPQAPILLGGHSAGAQLAVSVLYNNQFDPALVPRVAGLLLVSGVYDLRPLVPTYVNKPLSLTPESAKALSPLYSTMSPWWDTSKLHNLLLVGQFDSPEFQRQSIGYFDQIKIKFDGKFYISLTDDHFTIVENMRNGTSLVGQQLQAYLQQFRKISSNYAWK